MLNIANYFNTLNDFSLINKMKSSLCHSVQNKTSDEFIVKQCFVMKKSLSFNIPWQKHRKYGASVLTT